MPLSRRTFNESKRYDTLVVQENTPPGDFEMVEMQDIQNAERRGFLTTILTDGAIADGFKIEGDGSSNAVRVLPGTNLVSGDRLLLPDIQHPLVGGDFVFQMPIVTPVTNRTDLVYLEVFRETVTPTQDPDIQDPLLGPTANRERTVYAFRIEEGGTTIPALPAGSVGKRLATIIRRGGDPAINAEDVTDVRDIAGLDDQLRPDNLIIVAQSGGQFTDLQTALNSITGASQSNPFTVIVEPGEYISTSPIVFSQSFVTVRGRSPRTSTIKVNPPSGTLEAFTVSADNVTLRDLGLDIQSGVAGNMVLLTQGAAITTRVENCLLGKQYFDENSTNVMKGIAVGGGSTMILRNSEIYGQNVGQGIDNGSGTVEMEDCLVSCHVVDALTGSGVYTLDGCTIITNERTVNVLGDLTARDSSFTTQDTKTVSGVSGNGMELGGSVTNTLTNCTIVSNINRMDVTDTSLQWKGTSLDMRMLLGGTGTSRFEDCVTAGVEIQAATAEFMNCVIGAQTFNFGSLAGFGSPAGIGIFGSADVRLHGCRNDAGENLAVVDNSNTRFQDCQILLNDNVTGIFIDNTAKPIITGCLFRTGGASTLCSSIQDTGSDPIFSGNHFQRSPSGGTPPQAIFGVASSNAESGQNTKSTAIGLLFSAAVTIEDITA